VSRYKAECEPYIYPRLQIICGAVARSGFITSYKFVLGAGAVCKNRDKQLTLSVLWARPYLFVSVPEPCLSIIFLFYRPEVELYLSPGREKKIKILYAFLLQAL
jgi:hypothetical protein